MNQVQKRKTKRIEDGDKEENATISSGKAMALGTLCVLPLVIIFGLIYRSCLPALEQYLLSLL